MAAPAPSGLIDTVDARNQPIGTIMRADALRAGVNFRTVHVLVHDDQGRLLVQQLAPSRERHPLLWGSSVAGYLHAGESYEAGAARRIREELGISPSLTWVGVTTMRDETATKFVGVFTAHAAHARVMDPEHVATLAYWTPQAVTDMVHHHADRLTATFRHVLDFVNGREDASERS